VKLSEARIWITGASSGIGEALVGGLTRAGARLAITARRVDELERVAAGVDTAAQRPVVVVPADVTDPTAVRAAVARVEAELGGIDLAIFNAGTYRPVAGHTLKTQDVVDLFQVNVFGVLYATEAVLPGMLARGRGRLAVTSSMVGMLPLPNAAAYGASKAAVTYAFEALRFDLEPRGVGITVIHPGFVRTPLTRPNRFWMPAMVSADEAAGCIVRGLERDRDEIDFPRRMALPVQLIRRLPQPLFRNLLRLGARLAGT